MQDFVWQTIAEGEGFTEGPLALKDEIVFVSVNRGVVRAAQLDGTGTRTIAETGGGPNGAAADGLDRIWIAQNGGRVMESKSFETAPAIQLIEHNGVHPIGAGSFDAPNDLTFGPDGRLFFTDPHGRLGIPTSSEPSGRVWAVDPSTAQLELVADKLEHPNGLCFTPDGNSLLVSDTRTRGITAYVSSPDGWISEPFASVPWGMPDGMAFDVEGRLWVASTDAEGLAVRGEDGRWELIELGPSFPTNVCFAGENLGTLVVTAARGGRILITDAPAPGLPLAKPTFSPDWL